MIPGGPSGDPGSPLYATQLGDWLTSDYHRVEMSLKKARKRARSSETFVPPLAP